MIQSPSARRQPPEPDSAAFKRRLTDAADLYPETALCGIVFFDPSHQPVVIREPFDRRRPLLVIVPRVGTVASSGASVSAKVDSGDQSDPTFWGRWGPMIQSCGGAGAGAAAIYFSAGAATMLVGAFALNSAALCGIKTGRAFAPREWEQFKTNGGLEYSTWMTVETGMELIEQLSGVFGALKFMTQIKRLGKLDDLKKAINSPNRTRKDLAKVIGRYDDSAISASSRSEYRRVGQVVLDNFKKRAIADGISAAFTVGGVIDMIWDNYDMLLLPPREYQY